MNNSEIQTSDKEKNVADALDNLRLTDTDLTEPGRHHLANATVVLQLTIHARKEQREKTLKMLRKRKRIINMVSPIIYPEDEP